MLRIYVLDRHQLSVNWTLLGLVSYLADGICVSAVFRKAGGSKIAEGSSDAADRAAHKLRALTRDGCGRDTPSGFLQRDQCGDPRAKTAI